MAYHSAGFRWGTATFKFYDRRDNLERGEPGGQVVHPLHWRSLARQRNSGLGPPQRVAVKELVRLGATVIGKHRISGHSWTVMQDPEGNEFCIAAKAFTGFD